ncbi:MAG: Gfo/Idh/MocA family oxidoreductase [Candidatus Bathyarchaeia archaeon]
MAANEKHWCHTFPGGRFSEMLAHPIYLVRHFLNGDPAVVSVAVSKIGDYSWMKSDELCAIFRVKNKLGRVYASFNSSRDAIYISVYGSKGILKLELINSTLLFLPKRKTSRFSKGSDAIKQALQLAKCTVANGWKISTGRWLSGHDFYIKSFAESLLNGGGPPVSVEDGLAVIRTLDEVCKRIVIQEK